MTVHEFFTYALVGAITFEYPAEIDQIQHLMRQWHSEWDTDIELVSFAQAFPDEPMLITDPDLPF